MALINIFVKLWNNLVPTCNIGKRVVIKLLHIFLNVILHIFNLNMDKWIPINGTYRGGIESLGIHRYMIPVWYQNLGIQLPKVVFPRVDGWSMGPPGFGASHSLPLQFIIGLPNSPKTEAKGVVLVKGPWYKTSGSLWLSFDLNWSLSFLGLFQLGGTCTPSRLSMFLTCSYFLKFL